MSTIYILNDGDEYYKIGLSGNVVDRINSLQSGNPRELKAIYTSCRLENAAQVEYAIHLAYRHKNVRNEWFRFSNDDVKTIIKVLEHPDLDGWISTCREQWTSSQDLMQKAFGTMLKSDITRLERLIHRRNDIMNKLTEVSESIECNEGHDKNFIETQRRQLRKDELERTNELNRLQRLHDELSNDYRTVGNQIDDEMNNDLR